MVSKHIVYLETRLGTRLLQRTTRSQSLTDFGRTYYERCKLVLAEVDAAESLAAQASSAPRGRVRVSAPVSFGAQTLTPMVADYLRQYPEVQIDLILNDRFVDLVDEGFEVAFRIGPTPRSNLLAHSLRPFRLVACASPTYLDQRGHPKEPADLANHECLRYAFWSAPVAGEWCFERDGRLHEPPVTGQFRTNDANSLLAAALGGLGIAFIAEYLARDALVDGRLKRVLPDHTTPARPMHLLTMSETRPPPKLRTFIDAALKVFGQTR
jgi:DNA-binding transcriptional LysR family regulator